MPELHSMSAAQWEASRDRSPAGRSAKGRLPWAVLFAELSQPSDRLAAGGLGESQTPRTQEEAHGFVTVVSWPGGPGKCRVEGYF